MSLPTRGRAAPGPAGYPLLGVLPLARRDLPAFFLESVRRYGDVVAMRFGGRRVYLLAHPRHVQWVLQDNHDGYGKSATAARVRSLFGDSLTTVDGDLWRQRRRLLGPSFSARRVGRVMPAVAGAVAAMLARWETITRSGQVIDILTEMRDVTRASIFRIVFGDMVSDARAAVRALEVALEHVDRRLWSPLASLDRLTPAHRRFRHAVQTVDAFLARAIDAAHQGGPSSERLISALMESHAGDGRAPMSDAALSHEIKAILVAGHTTTANALAWVWYLISRNAAARDRLREELRVVLGGRDPRPEDLARLEYTRMLIAETLRLYPPTWVTARVGFRDDAIDGFRIPAGAIVLLSAFVTHRHREFWPDPERFDPERFGPARSGERPSFAYFPFGGGPRSCIGSGLALAEMQLVVATVAQRYDIDVVSARPVELSAGLTLGPRRGLPVTLRRRCPDVHS
jgi:cytochrome P450